MTQPTYFDLRAAEAAEDREENGADLLPGDRELIAALDGYRQQQWDNYWQPIEEAEHQARLAEWLATQCPGCEDGGSGEPCAEHLSDADACIACDDGTGTVVCANCAEVPA